MRVAWGSSERVGGVVFMPTILLLAHHSWTISCTHGLSHVSLFMKELRCLLHWWYKTRRRNVTRIARAAASLAGLRFFHFSIQFDRLEAFLLKHCLLSHRKRTLSQGGSALSAHSCFRYFRSLLRTTRELLQLRRCLDDVVEPSRSRGG